MTDLNPETGLIGGVERRVIQIVDYQSDWPDQFEVHRRVIHTALQHAAPRIEHIGSTSVPGLAAKPIIDILLVVANSADEASYLPHLQRIGYQLRVREPDWREHRMLRTLEKDVHIHVYLEGCVEIARNVTFRDRLRRSAEDRRRYELVKRELAERSWNDMNEYAAAKTAVIENVLAAANDDVAN